MPKAAFIYDPVFLKHLTPTWHPERPQRLKAIIEALKASPVWDKLMHLPPLKASFEDIEAVHTKEYVQKMRTASPGYLDPDTYMSEDSLEAALFAAGAPMKAIEECKKGNIERAFCAVRPPGHHAEAHRAMGFCLFNNVAVGARYAQKMGYGRVFIVDFDVHHGNGTQHIFEEDDTVFYFSTHQFPHYPGTGDSSEKGRGKGEGYTGNFPLPSGAGDKEFHQIYHDVLPGIMAQFKPDIVIVSAGYDIHANDPLAGFRLSFEGIRDMVRGILSQKDMPYVFCLEGGYNLSALGASVLATIEEMVKA